MAIGVSTPALSQSFDYSFSADTLGGLNGTQSGSFSVFYDVGTATYSLTAINYSIGSTVFDLGNTGSNKSGNYFIFGGSETGSGGVASSTDDFFLQTLTGPQIGDLVAVAFAFSTSGSQAFGLAGPGWGSHITAGSTVTITNLTSAVPESATWAMMLLGFGAVGCAMRRSKKKQAVLQLA